MDAPFTTPAWGGSPPFRLNSATRTSTALSALDKSSRVMPRGSGESGAAMTVTTGGGADGSAFYPADATPLTSLYNARTAGGGGLHAALGPSVRAVATISQQTAGANALVPTTATYPSPHLRQAPFAGLYEDVTYPLRTLFAPPRPPWELPPRVVRPNRAPVPVYNNDLAAAGEREHKAQREVSRVWRGVLCRRRLHQARTLEDDLNRRARIIQCWWRCLQARWRRRQLTEIRAEWAKEQTAHYVAQRVLNTTAMIYWQHGKYEGAAVQIQRLVRYFLRALERDRCAERGLPPLEWPPALNKPQSEKRRSYFPWRKARAAQQRLRRQQQQQQHQQAASGVLVVAGNDRDVASAGLDSVGTAAGGPPHIRTLLQFRATKPPIQPPAQAEVEQINAKMRQREQQQQQALQTPEAVSRQEWKTEGMRREDLDFNAGIVQRFYRRKKVPQQVHTREYTSAYFNKAVRIIARTFRMYVLVKHMHARRTANEEAMHALLAKRSAEGIAHLTSEAVWQKERTDAAAITIQRCWHWWHYQRDGTVPTSYAASQRVPTPPCYYLIQAHIERERALRLSTMNLLDQHKHEKLRRHKYMRYVPAHVTVYTHEGFFALSPPQKP